jgi:UDP-N-acetylglucosamine 2-epimerase (non-hydrolysing)
MAASIAAFYAAAKVGHIEAGLRTGDKTQPFPEETNRRVASVIADLHFAPTETARQNLLRENVPAETILVTGNPVIDALHIVEKLPCDLEQGPLANIPWDKQILLVTAHRRENLGRPLESICRAVREIAQSFNSSVHIVYPVHLNPDVWKPVHQHLGTTSNITLVSPLDYLSLVQVLKRSYLVLTDSGGLQEEAPSLGKPVLVLRNSTERPEAIEAGTARLVGSAYRKIVAETARLLVDTQAYKHMAQAVNPYGDGQAAKRIVSALMARLS